MNSIIIMRLCLVLRPEPSLKRLLKAVTNCILAADRPRPTDVTISRCGALPNGRLKGMVTVFGLWPPFSRLEFPEESPLGHRSSSSHSIDQAFITMQT